MFCIAQEKTSISTFDELGGEISQAFASTLEVLVFGDYNIVLLKQDVSSKLYCKLWFNYVKRY